MNTKTNTPEATEAEAKPRLVPAKLENYTRQKVDGKMHIHCNDDVAKKLLAKSLDETYELTAKTLGVPEKDLRQRYASLNVGMQRMNLGNKLRGWAKLAAAA